MTSDEIQPLTDPRHLRRDSADIVRLLSLGVIPHDRVEGLIIKTVDLMESAAEKKRRREFAALMKLLIAAAKLGIAMSPKAHNHVHAILTPDERAAFERARALFAEAQSRGLVDGTVADPGTDLGGILIADELDSAQSDA